MVDFLLKIRSELGLGRILKKYVRGFRPPKKTPVHWAFAAHTHQAPNGFELNPPSLGYRCNGSLCQLPTTYLSQG